jgi:hypothetical protein
MDRKELLKALVEMREPISGLLDITPQHVIMVLTKYVDGHIESGVVQEWADSIHVRDDIDLDPMHEQSLRGALHELANPYLVQPLTVSSARRLIEKLETREGTT